MKCYYYLQVLLNVAKSITTYTTIKLKKPLKQKQLQELIWFQIKCFGNRGFHKTTFKQIIEYLLYGHLEIPLSVSVRIVHEIDKSTSTRR